MNNTYIGNVVEELVNETVLANSIADDLEILKNSKLVSSNKKN